jgi:hypothetical protein
MDPLSRRLTVDPFFTEGSVAQHMAEGGAALAQDLFAMGDEQQPVRVELELASQSDICNDWTLAHRFHERLGSRRN